MHAFVRTPPLATAVNARLEHVHGVEVIFVAATGLGAPYDLVSLCAALYAKQGVHIM